MKKIICLLLILTMSLALFACGADTAIKNENEGNVAENPQAPGNGGNEGGAGNNTSGGFIEGDIGSGNGDGNSLVAGGGNTVSAEDLFFRMIQNSNPNKITTFAYTTHTATGDVYEGKFVTTIYSEDRIDYYYRNETKAIVTPDEVLEGSKKVAEGTIEYANGYFSYVDEDGNKTTATAMPNVDVLGANFNIVKENLGKYRFAADGKTLMSNITAAQAEALLGVSVNAKGNVTVSIVTNGTYISKVTVNYSNDVAQVSIETSYTYEVLK